LGIFIKPKAEKEIPSLKGYIKQYLMSWGFTMLGIGAAASRLFEPYVFRVLFSIKKKNEKYSK